MGLAIQPNFLPSSLADWSPMTCCSTTAAAKAPIVNPAGGAWHVLHDDRRTSRHMPVQVTGDQPAVIVERAAGRGADDEGDRLAAVEILRVSRLRTGHDQREAGGEHRRTLDPCAHEPPCPAPQPIATAPETSSCTASPSPITPAAFSFR